MKIILNKKQLQILKEQKIEHTPDKISQYVAGSKKFLNKTLDMINIFKTQITNISISEITDDKDKFNELLNSIQNLTNKSKEISDKMYDVVDNYSVDEFESIAELDTLANEIQNANNILNNLLTILKNLMDFSDELSGM